MSDLRGDDGGLNRAEVHRRLKSGLAVLVSLAILGGIVWVGWTKGYAAYMDWRQTDDYIGTGDVETQIVIPSGATVRKIGDICVQAGVVRSAKAFEQAAAAEPKSTGIQAGTYAIKTRLPAATAVQVLINPANKVVKRVVIPEGKRLTGIVPLLVAGSGLTTDDFTKALADPSKLGLSAWAEGQPEGFLFPDSYEVGNPADATTILATMAKQFTSVAGDLNLEARAAELGYTPRQIVTVASIIEAEVSRPEDRPMVARAIYNRLEGKTPDGKPMKLQLDSTVIYAVGAEGRLTTTDAERATVSPYNTYLVDGLPPGPINSPGKAAMEAALNPDDGDWLYWVVVNPQTGETKFATTYADHQANVAEFQQWCKANAGKC